MHQQDENYHQRNRAIGALLGLAVGDAIGAPLEFQQRDANPPLTDMIGGGPFNLRPGEWTDDTAMALALADSLLANGGLDEADLMTRFLAWFRHGEYSCTGTCFDIGITTANALRRWEELGLVQAGSTQPSTAGNGSLMRLAPVPIRFWRDRDRMRDAAARQSKVTHAAPEAVDACVAYSEIVADAIEGRSQTEVLRSRDGRFAPAVHAILNGSWRGKTRDEIKSSGYVIHSLEAALWCFANTCTFNDAVLLAANLGGDSDTTAAITGQLAGAFYGLDGIPERYVERVAWSYRTIETAINLFDHDLFADLAGEA